MSLGYFPFKCSTFYLNSEGSLFPLHFVSCVHTPTYSPQPSIKTFCVNQFIRYFKIFYLFLCFKLWCFHTGFYVQIQNSHNTRWMEAHLFTSVWLLHIPDSLGHFITDLRVSCETFTYGCSDPVLTIFPLHLYTLQCTLKWIKKFRCVLQLTSSALRKYNVLYFV